jgi:hypothetical protein
MTGKETTPMVAMMKVHRAGFDRDPVVPEHALGVTLHRLLQSQGGVAGAEHKNSKAGVRRCAAG